MGKKRHRAIEYEEGSGNVFADLGLEDADALFTRAQIGFYIGTLIKARKLKPPKISTLLNLAPSEVLPLLSGQYGHFTIDQLFGFLKQLDRHVTIRIRPHQSGEPYQAVEFTPE